MTLPTLLLELCRPIMPPCEHLETQQALVKQFAEILEFTLKFDELKVCLYCHFLLIVSKQ